MPIRPRKATARRSADSRASPPPRRRRHAAAAAPRPVPAAAGLRALRRALAALGVALVAANLIAPVARFDGFAAVAALCHGLATPAHGAPAAPPWLQHCCFAAALALSCPPAPEPVVRAPPAGGTLPSLLARTAARTATTGPRIRAPPG